MNLQERAKAIFKILKKQYQPKASDFVIWKKPLELVIATILSAQCTDKRVNYRSKAKYLKGVGEMLLCDFGGKVPNTFDDLMKLPGVSHKTANLIMAKLYQAGTGVAVDTHVMRLSQRMGLTKHHAQVKIETDLNALFAPKDYLAVNELMILHGRAICMARSPKCLECPVKHLCPKRGTAYENKNAGIV
ncbi:MAG: Endonuclease III [Candidatus Uhrbacteria bacterium GW2011_GWA2_53_10]|uniref:Endonuclease III n=1 Tax=Candidatus Uhrbacteria bacterium GW2011_GWA2_53_10 TaxID=1618980 RepID=A0A0G2AIT8_9BACT|nr:MAG: Endonuclease III [Candidatus Uhrbacteria bacterium GW2011_GWA2_53_10]